MPERVYAGLSADERSTRRFEQFLDAGLAVFAERGWAASTVTDVCRAAGLSPRYFYELFGTREELFRAVTARIADDVHETVRRAVAVGAPGPQDRARAVLAALADWFVRDPRAVQVALVESLATPEFRRQRHELVASFSTLAARLMRPLRGRAGTLDDELATSATVLTGGLIELLMGRAGSPVPVTDDLDPLLDHLTALFTAAARM